MKSGRAYAGRPLVACSNSFFPSKDDPGLVITAAIPALPSCPAHVSAQAQPSRSPTAHVRAACARASAPTWYFYSVHVHLLDELQQPERLGHLRGRHVLALPPERQPGRAGSFSVRVVQDRDGDGGSRT